MCPLILWTLVICLINFKADVMPCCVQADVMPWQILLPYVGVVDGKPQRQMLSPLLHQGGRCYCHSLVMWQLVGHTGYMLQHLKDGRCYCQVADRIATAGWVADKQ